MPSVFGARGAGLASRGAVGADWIGWFIFCLLKRNASSVSVMYADIWLCMYGADAWRELAFENPNNALAARCANRNETARRASRFVELRKHLREAGDNSSTGCGEWMTGGERAAVDVQFRTV